MTYEIHERLKDEEVLSLGVDSPPTVKAVGVWYPRIYGIEDGRMREAIHTIGRLEFKNPDKIYRIIEIHYQSRSLTSKVKNGE